MAAGGGEGDRYRPVPTFQPLSAATGLPARPPTGQPGVLSGSAPARGNNSARDERGTGPALLCLSLEGASLS